MLSSAAMGREPRYLPKSRLRGATPAMEPTCVDVNMPGSGMIANIAWLVFGPTPGIDWMSLSFREKSSSSRISSAISRSISFVCVSVIFVTPENARFTETARTRDICCFSRTCCLVNSTRHQGKGGVFNTSTIPATSNTFPTAFSAVRGDVPEQIPPAFSRRFCPFSPTNFDFLHNSESVADDSPKKNLIFRQNNHQFQLLIVS